MKRDFDIRDIINTPDEQQSDWRNDIRANDWRDDSRIERLEAERDALLAEHEAVAALKQFVLENAADVYSSPRTEMLAMCMENAHDNAERVIRGE